ncbi:MAG TPA: FTR1 family protein [Rhizomicrobium sp.]|jgi:high-affinity iron transporter|nr:FTR1 family protein [Rhizomicrobium sp.]
MISSLIIVFREVIEAGLIVGIVLAATAGVPQRGRFVALGVAAGVVGACLVAAFAGELANLFEGSGQEFFNASILLLAVAMLTWHNVWMASHGRQMALELKAAGHQVKTGERTLTALAVVVGVAVLREGSEVVLFLYGIAAQGGTSATGMVAGGALGLAGGAAVSALMYFGLLSIPAGKLFQVTSGLITLLAAGMAAQAVIFLQNGGWLLYFTGTVWDTSWLLKEDSIAGRLLHTLVGYSEAPNGAQLIAYGATVLTIVALMRLVNQRHQAARVRHA